VNDFAAMIMLTILAAAAAARITMVMMLSTMTMMTLTTLFWAVSSSFRREIWGPLFFFLDAWWRQTPKKIRERSPSCAERRICECYYWKAKRSG